VIIIMGIILWIILGALSGWIASMIVKTDAQQGFFGDVILGIIGAIVGGFLFNLFGASGVNGFNVYSILVAVIGAVVVVFIGRAILGGRGAV
jgi:uncharacterized membrane protein YeaQ/YmgE (transglycosylase-associated protein family)